MPGLTEVCIFIEEYVKLELLCSVQIIHIVDFSRQSKKAGKRGINGILNLSLISEKTITFVCFVLKKTYVQCYCTKLFIYCNTLLLLSFPSRSLITKDVPWVL